MTHSNRLARVSASHSLLRGWINVNRVELLMPDGFTVERHVEHHGSGVGILPYDAERRTALLISQPRAPVLLSNEADVLEVIAGRLDNSSPEDRGRQEALEEAGLIVDKLELVVNLWSMPSISTERLSLFLAGYNKESRISIGGGCSDEHENISDHEFPLKQLAVSCAEGKILDAKTLILIQALQLRRSDLFL